MNGVMPLDRVNRNLQGATITMVSPGEKRLALEFEREWSVEIRYAAQCCERLYMVVPEEIVGIIGSKFMGIEVLDGPSVGYDEKFEYRDSQFLVLRTDKETVTITSYNEHNGYYAGFNIEVELKKVKP